MPASKLCLCGSQLPVEKCCPAIIKGELPAASPEALMRSRFYAFLTGNIHYLIATLHPSQRKENDEEILRSTIESTQWIGLKILKTDDRQHTVEYVAFYSASPVGQLHERSKFIKENDRWYYLNGTILPPIRIGRNDPCICNSGKKYKRCHGAN